MVIGGGLLGLEAAGALQGLDVSCTVVQSSDRLMSAQLDLPGGNALRRLIESRGIKVKTGSITTRLDADRSGAVTGLEFRDGAYERADVVVFTVGVRPRDELAREASLDVHPRGGADRRRLPDLRSAHPRGRRGRELRRDGRGPRRRLRDGRGRSDAASRRRRDLPRLRPLDEAQAERRGCRELRRRVRRDTRCARCRLRRPRRGRLQEARPVGRRQDPPRRHPRRRRLGVRIAPAPRRRRPGRRPRRVPHARRGRRGTDGRASR